MKLGKRLRRWIPPTIVGLVGLTAWEGLVRSGFVPAYVVPAPSDVLDRLMNPKEAMLHHLLITTGEIILGFAAAAFLGVLLAMLVVYVKPFETAFYPWIVATQAVPKVAMGPLFIFWLGFGLVPKIVIAFLIAFFPVFIDALVGLRSVDPDGVKLMRSMGASGWQAFRYLRLPQALPSLFAGLKVGITFATVGAVVGEFIGANEGLGYLLLYANASIDTPLLFVALLLVSIVSLLLYGALTAVERVCIRWHVSVRSSSHAATL